MPAADAKNGPATPADGAPADGAPADGATADGEPADGAEGSLAACRGGGGESALSDIPGTQLAAFSAAGERS